MISSGLGCESRAESSGVAEAEIAEKDNKWQEADEAEVPEAG